MLFQFSSFLKVCKNENCKIFITFFFGSKPRDLNMRENEKSAIFFRFSEQEIAPKLWNLTVPSLPLYISRMWNIQICTKVSFTSIEFARKSRKNIVLIMQHLFIYSVIQNCFLIYYSYFIVSDYISANCSNFLSKPKSIFIPEKLFEKSLTFKSTNKDTVLTIKISLYKSGISYS